MKAKDKISWLVFLVWITLGSFLASSIINLFDWNSGFWFYLGYLSSLFVFGALAIRFGD